MERKLTVSQPGDCQVNLHRMSPERSIGAETSPITISVDLSLEIIEVSAPAFLLSHLPLFPLIITLLYHSGV